MSIVSFSFIIFLILSVLVYYICPKKYRWFILLISSVIFFGFACSYLLLLYMAAAIITGFIGTIFIQKEKNEKKKKVYLIISLMIIFGMLITLKWINIVPLTINGFIRLFSINMNELGMLNLLAPLGVSYYTLSLAGYIIDVYRGAYERETNILKLSLFTMYYPILVSGPFVRYQDMKKELFEEKRFSYDNIFQGFERILYGLLKKLVIADVLATYVQAIFADWHLYSGYYIIIGLVLYAIQIYTDFSGCMDIVFGASKMYGITLKENFNSPFMSKNLSEFWRRWHISLGQWGKDYIMYPLLKSSAFQKLGVKCRAKFGKQAGKLIVTLTSILILWLFIGIWHGASYKYIFCAGVLPWIYLALGQIFEKKIEAFNKKMKIRTECFSFELFRRIRTLGFMCFIWLFACAPKLVDSFSIIRNIFRLPGYELFDTLPYINVSVVFFSIALVMIVDYLKYKEINVLEKFNEQNVIFKYLLIFIIIYTILMFGAYGPGFDMKDFIYGGF